MSEVNTTTKSNKKQYHHLTKEQRAQIEILLNAKNEDGNKMFNNTYIANIIGVHKYTTSRKLRNRIKSKINVISENIRNKPYNATDAYTISRYSYFTNSYHGIGSSLYGAHIIVEVTKE